MQKKVLLLDLKNENYLTLLIFLDKVLFSSHHQIRFDEKIINFENYQIQTFKLINCLVFLLFETLSREEPFRFPEWKPRQTKLN